MRVGLWVAGALALGAGVAGSGLMAGGTQAAPTYDDPAAFVRRLYADEAAIQAHRDPMWWGRLGGRARTLYGDVQKVEARTRDALIDEDFLCQCQDPEGIRLTSLGVTRSSPTRARAHVRFAFGGGPQNGTGALTLDLVRGGDGWRIAEMTNSKGQTFTSELAAALRSSHGR